MAARQAASKLHMITLVRSPCNRPKEVRATLERLGLKRMSQKVVHKNTPAINGMLRKVIEHVSVVPLTFDAASKPEAANRVDYGEGQAAFVLPNGTVQGLSEAEFKALEPADLEARLGGVAKPRTVRKGAGRKRRQEERKLKHMGNIPDSEQWVD